MKVQEALIDDEYTKYCDAKIANGATVNQIMSRQDWHYCWNKSQSALAEIEKCEPVAIVDVESNTGARLLNSIGLNDGDLLYTSPISKEHEDWQYFDEAYKKATESSDPDDWMNAALMAQQVRRKQLNAPEKG